VAVEVEVAGVAAPADTEIIYFRASIP
jgi:hypothetical protein